MFEDGDWVVFTRDNPDGGRRYGHKGMVVQLKKVPGIDHLLKFKHPNFDHHINVRPDTCCRKLLVNESYMVLVSEHIGDGDWSDPWPAYMETLDQFRREVRDYEEDPETYRILAKKKITTPYQDPNLDEILEEPARDVGIHAGIVNVMRVGQARAVPAAPAADWAAMVWDDAIRPAPIVARDELLDLPVVPIEEEL